MHEPPVPPVVDENARKSPFDRLNILSANVALFCALPFFAVFAILGDQGRGMASAISVGMMVLIIWMRWDLRKRFWFWTVVASLVLLHIPLVMLVHWSSRNTYSRVVLLPGALLDFVIVYSAIQLVEKLMKRGDEASTPS